jgi:hypothetical protein
LRHSIIGAALAGAALLATMVAAAPSAGAAGMGGWAIAPFDAPGTATSRAVFEFAGHAGQTFTDRFTVANRSPQDINFSLYSADAYNTRVAGAFALKLANEPQTDVGKWITLPTGTLHLPAQTQATVTFTVRIPRNAYPGDHTGGIVAQDSTPTMVQQGAVQVPELRGAGVRVYIRVLGPVHPSLAVTHTQITSSYPAFAWLSGADKGRVSFDVANTGNERLDVVADVKAVDLFGSTVKSYPPVKLPAFLPGSSSFIAEPVITLPRWGLVRFEISLHARGASVTASVQQYLIPWVLVAIVLVLLLVFGFWWRRRRRRRKAGPQEGPDTLAPPKPSPQPTAVG